MGGVRRALLLLLVLLLPVCGHAEEAGGLSSAVKRTGMPVPRFASLKTGEINLRTGPGTRYPISWVYKRKGLPVEIIAEFDTWRRIRDVDGASGWVHQAALTGKRNALVVASGLAPIYRDEDMQGAPKAQAETGAMGRVVKCDANWCKMDFDGTRGYMARVSLWGVYPDEKVE